MKKNIFLIGAGRSATSLIKYLLDGAEQEDWYIRIGEQNVALAEEKINHSPFAEALVFDVNNDYQRLAEINKADLVISMLPAHMHVQVAKDCISLGKHMVTASYVSDEMAELNTLAEEAGVVILNEIGVDPGIDHMEAMRILDKIKKKDYEMSCFETFTGGLVAPESDNNPWGYKFTWNPRNVVLAGQGGAAKFIQEGQYKYIPYTKLFRRTEVVSIDGYGDFEGYANRDSLKYRSKYGLENIPTIYRGTFRRKGFCRAWDVFVQLGATDDTYILEGSGNMTHRQFINAFLAYHKSDSVELKLMHYLKIDQDDSLMDKLSWLGIFDNTKIDLPDSTPAQILQHILEKKWVLEETDKDMIVMWHKFIFSDGGESRQWESSLVVKGEDDQHTAMAKTVGYPVGIGVKLILNGTIKKAGVRIPTTKDIYEPVLEELEQLGVKFESKETTPVLC